MTHHSPLATHLYAYDGNGNVTALLNSADGSVSARYEYGPFGEPLRATGVGGDANPFGWSTKSGDPESGLLNFGYRLYSPALGRWLTQDPMEEEGGLNLYALCENSPVNAYDALGLSADPEDDRSSAPCRPWSCVRRAFGMASTTQCRWSWTCAICGPTSLSQQSPARCGLLDVSPCTECFPRLGSPLPVLRLSLVSPSHS